jgi:hypothetical protein
MASPAPANIKTYQDRKLMTDEDTQRVEQFKRDKEMHRLIRKYGGPEIYSIYTHLVDQANPDHDGGCWPSYEYLMKELSINNRAAIADAFHWLFDLGLIEWGMESRKSWFIPVIKADSALIERLNQALSFAGETIDSSHRERLIVRIENANVYQSNVNQINELKTTPNGVEQPRSKTIDLVDFKPVEPEPQPEETIPDALLPDTFEATTKPGPLATDRDRVGVGEDSNSKHIPASHQLDLGQEVKGFEAGGGGRDMTSSSKARDKPKPKPKKEPDPNSSHPAVEIYKQVFRLSPRYIQMTQIVLAIGDTPDALVEWRECLTYWGLHGKWDVTNVDGMIKCYKNGSYKDDGYQPGRPVMAGNGITSSRAFNPAPKPIKPRGSRADGGFTTAEFAEDY